MISKQITMGILLSVLTNSLALADAGPGDDNPEISWNYCMQEAIKAEVWSSKIAPEKVVANAYRVCRPEFKILMTSLPDDAARQAFRRKEKAYFPQHVAFAKRMANAR
jgi:hypothetical protein